MADKPKTIDIGTHPETGQIFIAVPNCMHDMYADGLLGNFKHAFGFEPYEVEWIVRTLATELGPDVARKLSRQIWNDNCPVCEGAGEYFDGVMKQCEYCGNLPF